MEKRARSVAAPTAGQLVLEALSRVRWQSLLAAARRLGLFTATLAGLGALLIAGTLVDSQIAETRRIEALTAQATQGAKTNQERFEKIDAFVYDAVYRAGGDQTIDRSEWILPPSGPVGFIVERFPAIGRYLKLFFEPHYDTFLKPNALQVYYYSSDCAGAARLMIRMLSTLGIQASKLGIHDETGLGRHAVVEANIDGRLAIADANHGYVYHRPDGSLATAEDIARNPEIALSQLKEKDNPIIADFRNLKTINWRKVPGLPFVYDLLRGVMGDRVDRIPRPAIVELPKLMSAATFFALGGLLLLPAASLAARRSRRLRLRDKLASLPAWLRARNRRADTRA